MAIDKLERQMGLLAALLHTERPLRAVEIHSRVEGYPDDSVAFRRAFERDKDDLRRLGIPLEVERTQTIDGTIDGYRVSQNDYYLHDLGLEPDEVVALSVALRLIRLEGAAADDALWKLGGAATANDTEPPQLAAISMGPAVTELHQAVNERAVVNFDYKGEARTVEPWRLAFRKGHWYLNGYDRAREDSRSFRLDRIEGAVQVGEPSTATQPRTESGVDRQPWQFANEDETSFTARVGVNASHARWAQHHLVDAQLIAENPDGSIEIELDVTNVAAFRSLILSMSDAAEILSPPEVRQDMIDWLERIVA